MFYEMVLVVWDSFNGIGRVLWDMTGFIFVFEGQ
jgi:hypothetical protein